MSWATIIMDPNDKKVKIDWFNLKTIVFGTIQRDQFLYIFFLNLITNIVLVATMFFSSFFDPSPSRSSFYFILSSFLHLHPPRVH